jgi:hypothetical protein
MNASSDVAVPMITTSACARGCSAQQHNNHQCLIPHQGCLVLLAAMPCRSVALYTQGLSATSCVGPEARASDAEMMGSKGLA